VTVLSPFWAVRMALSSDVFHNSSWPSCISCDGLVDGGSVRVSLPLCVL
jgi:hypothetical protein